MLLLAVLSFSLLVPVLLYAGPNPYELERLQKISISKKKIEVRQKAKYSVSCPLCELGACACEREVRACYPSN